MAPSSFFMQSRALWLSAMVLVYASAFQAPPYATRSVGSGVAPRSSSSPLCGAERPGRGGRSIAGHLYSKIQLSGRREHLIRLMTGAVLTTAVDAASAKDSLPGSGRLADMKADATTDVIHPASLLGTWDCERAVKVVEGDAEQAALVWLALGGVSANAFASKAQERFETRFVSAPKNIKSGYVFEGLSLSGVVLDRGFEIASRTGGTAVGWDATCAGSLKFERGGGGGATEHTVVQRTVEMPSEKGWGGSELIALSVPAGGLFGESRVVKVGSAASSPKAPFRESTR